VPKRARGIQDAITQKKKKKKKKNKRKKKKKKKKKGKKKEWKTGLEECGSVWEEGWKSKPQPTPRRYHRPRATERIASQANRQLSSEKTDRNKYNNHNHQKSPPLQDLSIAGNKRGQQERGRGGEFFKEKQDFLLNPGSRPGKKGGSTDTRWEARQGGEKKKSQRKNVDRRKIKQETDISITLKGPPGGGPLQKG